ncbi:MAG: hypothetical protein JWO03_1892 [Bacteroidetes bacterium]|nr:hypothetical protein [Bacteroidota bacterium]
MVKNYAFYGGNVRGKDEGIVTPLERLNTDTTYSGCYGWYPEYKWINTDNTMFIPGF